MKSLSANTSTSNAKYITSKTESKHEGIRNFQKALWDIKKRMHQHVESTHTLRYMDAIKDALHNLNVLERRLKILQQPSNDNLAVKSETTTTFEMESLYREIQSLNATVRCIIENDG